MLLLLLETLFLWAELTRRRICLKVKFLVWVLLGVSRCLTVKAMRVLFSSVRGGGGVWERRGGSLIVMRKIVS